jgi:hypothetical protein
MMSHGGEYTNFLYPCDAGDTEVTVTCPHCGTVHHLIYEPSRIMMLPVGLDCMCGEYTDLRVKA